MEPHPYQRELDRIDAEIRRAEIEHRLMAVAVIAVNLLAAWLIFTVFGN